jgi:arginyl-tRNA synthetase
VIVVKSNGGTTYLARDIAAAIDRVENLRCSDLLYEVGQEQELHFKQLFAILKLLGFEWANRCRHLGHGFYRLPEGKMSTREGRTVLMEDVVQESIQRVKKIIEEKNPELAKGEEFEETARTVGVGAIAFFDLQSDRLKDVLFDWNRILDFQGETGPYVQYTHARICSILRKYEKEVSDVSYDLFTASEKEMFLKLQSFGSVVEQAAKHHKPHVICRYVLDVCQLFNEYYAKNQVISNDETLTATRVVFIDAIRQVLANAIRLLGMRAPQQM